MEGIRKAMNERNLNESQWEDRKQWSLGVGQRRKTFWNRYTCMYMYVCMCVCIYIYIYKLLFWIPTVLSKLSVQKIFLGKKCRSNLLWQMLRENQHKAIRKKECQFDRDFVHGTRESAVECNSTWYQRLTSALSFIYPLLDFTGNSLHCM